MTTATTMYHIQCQRVQLKVDLKQSPACTIAACTIRHNSDRLIIKGSIGHLQPPLPAADIIACGKKAAHIISDEKSPTFRTLSSFDHFIWFERWYVTILC